ncbi:uncharacterized protein NECHADRAFT_87220 [Fusarium vanettenii 77-13-4]|uniref:Condensation domain-containing protein n=1 Tax=Fusarium vanettenii (strain ATCC MYA-4622 / CBS 123669 / FGSC 9596 / NRRL 45880 / 77-13-4) TaxID=660122 RepID=C7ZIP9_FUSV7|nr:uncharacterized protein NECHADRAFT_87220 [Fusarium vanettenii 77-13-4]EEU36125.1 hypothetical protein NECHADRAFT_87220 [Fusarium vanettenii 77-13-4]
MSTTLPFQTCLLQADGTSVRPLDTIETFFKLLADGGAPINREHWAITIALRLKIPESVKEVASVLRRTWLILVRLHPNLVGTARISGAEDPPGQILSVGPLNEDKWLAQSFFHHEIIPDSTTLFASLRPSPTAACHWIPTSQELCISSSHWRIDGIGMLMLANSFMKSLAEILRHDRNDPTIQGPLTPSLDTIVGSYLDEETTPMYLRSTANALVAEFVKGVPSIGLPTIPGSLTAAPGPTERQSCSFDATITKAIIAACKKRHLSVPSAVHAALVRVTATYPQHPLAKSYAAFFPTDLRPYLPSPYNGESFAVGMFCSGLPVTVPDVLGLSFDAITTILNNVYRRDLTRMCTDDEGNPQSMLDLMAPYVRRTTKLFNTPPPPKLPPVENPDLSSFGKIEQYLQHEYAFGQGGEDKVEVDGFWIGTETLARSLQCHVWAFKDQLTIQGCFNTSFYGREFVCEVLEKVKVELVEGLGV